MKNLIHADELAGVLQAVDDIDVLSLDCFDTLIWRTTPEPPDVFCGLRAPMSRMSRQVAEQTARQRRLVAEGLGEVTLEDIYRCALPSADNAEIRSRIAEELALEYRHCVAFPPAVELIREAKRRGKKVVVVSDTYLRTEELQDLIAAKAGADVLALIDVVFCSSAFGVGKAQGLFKHVLSTLGVPRQRVLHIGDNAAADFEAAADAGMRALHLLQGDRSLEEQWRLELAALLMAVDGLRHRAVPLLPYRPLLAQTARPITEAGRRIGYGTLGPLMYGFARWVLDEARQLAAGGRSVRVCFLMRDGHLPRLAYDALAQDGDPPSFSIEVSRFTAFAATFGSAADVRSYVGMLSTTNSLEPLMRQLLLTPEEIAPLQARAARDDKPTTRLVEQVTRPKMLAKVTARSAVERRRLLGYLRRQVNPQSGDMLLLVDVGAAGTVQNRIQDVLVESFGVDVEGRYLLLRDVPRASDSKRGYFGPDRLDARLLEALYTYISVVEQLSTVAQGSVIGYSDEGAPRRKAADFSAHQVAERERVQAACLDFLRAASASAAAESADARWHGALASFTRLLCLPLQEEAEFFAAFSHDVNMGVADTVPMVDAVAAREDMRRIGAAYVKFSPRVYAPAELRRQGLEQALLLLTHNRFDLDLRRPDYRNEAMELSVMIARDGHSAITRVEALPTYDGFYAVSIPIGRCEFAVGILFGQLFEWVQLESARVAPVAKQFKAVHRDQEIDLTTAAVHEGIRREAGGLLHCQESHGFTYFEPPLKAFDENCVLRVVFRPIVVRPGADLEARPHRITELADA